MRITISVLAALVLVTVASAHHSIADLDRTSWREIEGEVVAVSWRNPHVRLRVRTQGSNGEEELWTLEGAAVYSLDNGGVSRDTVSVGDHIKAAGRESTRRDYFLGGPSLLLPGGREVSLTNSQTTSFWAGSFERGAHYAGDISAERVAASRENASGIFRVWASRVGSGSATVVWPEELPLREDAESAQRSWDPDADPINQCDPPGMPRAVSHNPFPIEFVSDGENVFMLLQEFDAKRVIHMTGVPADEQTSFTPLGYSTGRWEDGNRILVVETTHIDYPLFNRSGVPQSREVQITERFTLNDDETQLGYEITLSDPVTFTASVVGTKHWTWMPGLERQHYDCGFLESAE